MEFSEIPVINLRSVMNTNSWGDESGLLRHACEEVGFFYIDRHGIDPTLLKNLVDVCSRFFSQPGTQKQQVRIDHTLRGYLPLGYRSYAGEKREGISHQEGYWMGYEADPQPHRPLDARNRWPVSPAEMSMVFERYLKATENLVSVLLRGFSLALELPEDTLGKHFESPTTRLKVNHYPPQPGTATESNLGVVPHTDSGAFTLLWQDNNGGLEIQSQSGRWVGAPPLEGTLVVNLGNIMQYWSNGRFTSTPHRVVNRQQVDRYSIPLFVNPDTDVTVEPLVDTNLPGFAPFNYGNYQSALWRRSFPI